jgi:hypothetical protein
MKATVIFDDSAPGAWRDALAPEGVSCAACGQNVCSHSDLEYQGVSPPVHAAENARG